MNFKIVILLSVLFIVSCKNDKTITSQSNSIVGDWTVTKAIRNGKLTNSLENGFFNFTKDSVQSNITVARDTLRCQYTLTEDQLLFNECRDLNYKVAFVATDSLILETKLRNYDFKFLLVKK